MPTDIVSSVQLALMWSVVSKVSVHPSSFVAYILELHNLERSGVLCMTPTAKMELYSTLFHTRHLYRTNTSVRLNYG